MSSGPWRYGIEPAGRSAVAFSFLLPPFLTDYYGYCLDVLKEALIRQDAALNVMFNNHHTAFLASHPVMIATMQYEHTLVKPDGFDPAAAVAGGIRVPGQERNYLVRIERYEDMKSADLVFEYSRPNIANIASCEVFREYLPRVAYVSPSFFEMDLGAEGRDIDILMLGHGTPRRQAFLERANAAGLSVTCVKGVFDTAEVRALYRRARILVNIRQTDVFDTLEELRVLPALRSGAIVVSEDVPLRREVPYHEHLAWARLEEMPEAVRRVQAGYDAHFARLIQAPRLSTLLRAMTEQDVANVAAVLRRVAARLCPAPATDADPGSGDGPRSASPLLDEAHRLSATAPRAATQASTSINLARGRPTRQSSGDADHTRSGAATSGNFSGLFSFCTDVEPNPWWEVDLGAVLPIGRIVVWNRDDAGVAGAERASPMRVLTSRDGAHWETLFYTQAVFGAKRFGEPLTVDTLIPALTRYVRLQTERTDYLHLDQVEVYLSLPPLPFAKLARIRITSAGPRATLRVTHNSGFFSVCSTTLETIIRLHCWGIVTEELDTTPTHSVSREAAGPADVHAALFCPPAAVALPALDTQAASYGPFNASHCHWHYRALDFAAITPFVTRHFSPRPEILALEERMLAGLGLDPQRTLALYYRGTDKSSEVAPTEIGRYIAEAERILAADPHVRMLVQTDQAQVRDAIATHFGERCVYFDALPVTTGNVGLHHDAHDMQSRYGLSRFDMAQRFLAAVRIMSRARHVITGTSNVALWISLYRGSAERLLQFDAQQELIGP